MANDDVTGTGWKYVLLTYAIALVLFLLPVFWLHEVREMDSEWWYVSIRILLVLVALYAAYKVIIQRDDNDPNGWRVALCALALAYAILTTAPASQLRQDNGDHITDTTMLPRSNLSGEDNSNS